MQTAYIQDVTNTCPHYLLPRLGTGAPRGRRAPRCTAGAGDTSPARETCGDSPGAAERRRGSKALFSAYRSRLSLARTPSAAPRTYLQPPFCPRARSCRSGSRHTQVCSAAPQARLPGCCSGATTHARPALGQADSESTCRVLTAAPGGKDRRPRAEVELQVLGEARERGEGGRGALSSCIPTAQRDPGHILR